MNKNTNLDLTHKHTLFRFWVFLFHLYSTPPPYHNLLKLTSKSKPSIFIFLYKNTHTHTHTSTRKAPNLKNLSLSLSLSIWTHRFLVSFTLFLSLCELDTFKPKSFLLNKIFQTSRRFWRNLQSPLRSLSRCKRSPCGSKPSSNVPPCTFLARQP